MWGMRSVQPPSSTVHGNAHAWEAFDDYVAQHAFVHDDVQYDLLDDAGEPDSDQFGSNAFLSGARVCVVSELTGFGQPFLEYLQSIACLPSLTIAPKMSG